MPTECLHYESSRRQFLSDFADSAKDQLTSALAALREGRALSGDEAVACLLARCPELLAVRQHPGDAGEGLDEMVSLKTLTPVNISLAEGGGLWVRINKPTV